MGFNKCFVPGCTTGCNVKTKIKKEYPEMRTLFKAPNDKALFEKWKRNIPRGGVDLIPGCLVCEIHFPQESIERHIETTMLDGTVCMIKRTKPVLKPGAVPTIFPNLPPHLYRTLKRVAPPTKIICDKKQKISASQTIEISSGIKEISEQNSDKIINDSEVTSSQNDIVENSIDHLLKPASFVSSSNVSSTQDYSIKNMSAILPIGKLQLPTSKLKEIISSQSYEVFTQEIKKSLDKTHLKSTLNEGKPVATESNQSEKLNRNKNKHAPAILSKSPNKTTPKKKNSNQKQCATPDTTENFQIIVAEGDNYYNDSGNNNEPLRFIYLKDNIEDVKVPSGHWSCSFLRNSIAFLDWGQNFEIRKKVIVNYEMKYKVFIMDKEIFIKGIDGPKSFQDLQIFLQIVDKITLCQGIENGEEKQWSKNCFGFAPPREEETKKIIKQQCDECVHDMKNTTIIKKKNAGKQLKRIQRLSTILSAEKLKNKDLLLMIKKLRLKIKKLSKQLESFKSCELLEFSKKVEEDIKNTVLDKEVDDKTRTNVLDESVSDMEHGLFADIINE